jgi:hypothetical protein
MLYKSQATPDSQPSAGAAGMCHPLRRLHAPDGEQCRYRTHRTDGTGTPNYDVGSALLITQKLLTEAERAAAS